MNKFAQKAYEIFEEATEAYHITDDVDAPIPNPYSKESVEHTLFEKNVVDVVQWHLEDIVRDPAIDPGTALEIKRRIDRSNQVRTDMVEQLDTYFLEHFSGVTPQDGATLNTESPAWALDRLSILAVKIYHMTVETRRSDATDEHRGKCAAKLGVLLEQRSDLITAIDQLLKDMESGRKQMKVYRQMKMYNDPSTNPVLYSSQKK